MNTKTFGIGIIVALAVGGAIGYSSGRKNAESVSAVHIQQMTAMMRMDGMSAARIGGIMISAGAKLKEKGVQYNDTEIVGIGKDLEVAGAKHKADGESMANGNMMEMTASGNMSDMPGMDMGAMNH